MDKFDSIITVEAPLDERVNRLTKRGLLHSEIERRIANQVSPDERKAVANFVIENDGTEDELLRKVENIWEELNASSH
jgi:dephospho-CoA kinase